MRIGRVRGRPKTKKIKIRSYDRPDGHKGRPCKWIALTTYWLSMCCTHPPSERGLSEAAGNTFVNKNCKQAFVFDPIKRGELKKIRLLFASQSAKSYKLKDFCYTPLFLGYFFSSLGLSPSSQRMGVYLGFHTY